MQRSAVPANFNKDLAYLIGTVFKKSPEVSTRNKTGENTYACNKFAGRIEHVYYRKYSLLGASALMVARLFGRMTFRSLNHSVLQQT